MGQVIDGKAVAATVRAEAKAEVDRLRALRPACPAPGLATVLVGDDPASRVYVGMKEKACHEVGIASFSHRLSGDTAESALLTLIDSLNAQPEVHGILVQLPLPPALDPGRVIESIRPDKDVDGLHPYNQGQLIAGTPGLRPCTPLGVMRLLDSTGTDLHGARAVVIGRSTLVGKPVGLMLLERHATVTLCHSRTRELSDEISRAEVVIAAMGQPEGVKAEWIRPGATVIDVGISRLPSGKLCGDVEFVGALERAAFITPVPGGVGPMTVAMLLVNTIEAARIAAETP